MNLTATGKMLEVPKVQNHKNVNFSELIFSEVEKRIKEAGGQFVLLKTFFVREIGKWFTESSSITKCERNRCA